MINRNVSHAFLVLASIVMTLVLLELGARIYTGDWGFRNILENHISLLMDAYPARYDETLGWAAKAGVSEHNASGARITILKNGLRSNGADKFSKKLVGQKPIVAVGDSFTFGFEVSDEQTWPAILESKLGRSVLNGGVFAYGMDQALIRTRQLVGIYKPEILIYSFIPDDIFRCQTSSRTGVNKPYFDVEDGALVLRNSPVPESALTDHGAPGVRRILGYSVLVHTLMLRSKYANWWLRGDQWENKQVHSNSKGDQIGCLIVKELDKLARSENMKIYLLAQYGRNINSRSVDRSRKVISCANPQWLTVVDLHEPLREVWRRDRKLYRSYFTKRQHMTVEGNRFAAMKLDEALNQPGVQVP
jgi:hypothetical protein